MFFSVPEGLTQSAKCGIFIIKDIIILFKSILKSIVTGTKVPVPSDQGIKVLEILDELYRVCDESNA